MHMSVDNENKDDDREAVIKRGLGKQAKKVAVQSGRGRVQTRDTSCEVVIKRGRGQQSIDGRMNYDEILERHLGETGIFFTGNILLLWLPAIAAGMIVLQTSFTGLPKRGGKSG